MHRFNVCNNLKLCLNSCFTVACMVTLTLIMVLNEKNIFIAFNV